MICVKMKIKGWEEYYFYDDTNVENLKKRLIENPASIIDRHLGFDSSKFLEESFEFVTPFEEGGKATIELYDSNDELLYTNARDLKGGKNTQIKIYEVSRKTPIPL